MEFRWECFEITVLFLGAKPHALESQISVGQVQLLAVLLAEQTFYKALDDLCSSLALEKQGSILKRQTMQLPPEMEFAGKKSSHSLRKGWEVRLM